MKEGEMERIDKRRIGWAGNNDYLSDSRDDTEDGNRFRELFGIESERLDRDMRDCDERDKRDRKRECNDEVTNSARSSGDQDDGDETDQDWMEATKARLRQKIGRYERNEKEL
jgi:hypothetical protein